MRSDGGRSRRNPWFSPIPFEEEDESPFAGLLQIEPWRVPARPARRHGHRPAARITTGHPCPPWRRRRPGLSRMPSPGPVAEALGPGQALRYFSFGSVFASSAAMMWYPGVFMWMLKVPSQKYVKVQTLATGTVIGPNVGSVVATNGP
jgi:hypothetical protein